jgi:monothiol glutaredoxin
MKGTSDFPQCGFSSQAVQVLEACAVDFQDFNIFEDAELREALKSYSNWPTYPQLYIKGELIGGSDIMVDLYKKGELAQMLAAATEV